MARYDGGGNQQQQPALSSSWPALGPRRRSVWYIYRYGRRTQRSTPIGKYPAVGPGLARRPQRRMLPLLPLSFPRRLPFTLRGPLACAPFIPSPRARPPQPIHARAPARHSCSLSVSHPAQLPARLPARALHAERSPSPNLLYASGHSTCACPPGWMDNEWDPRGGGAGEMLAVCDGLKVPARDVRYVERAFILWGY